MKELSRKGVSVITSKDNIVVFSQHDAIHGGLSLDMTGFPDEVIKAGHIVIQDDTTKIYKPMPVEDNAYASMPSGHSYFGAVGSTMKADEPKVPVFIRGRIQVIEENYTPTSAML